MLGCSQFDPCRPNLDDVEFGLSLARFRTNLGELRMVGMSLGKCGLDKANFDKPIWAERNL